MKCFINDILENVGIVSSYAPVITDHMALSTTNCVVSCPRGIDSF